MERKVQRSEAVSQAKSELVAGDVDRRLDALTKEDEVGRLLDALKARPPSAFAFVLIGPGLAISLRGMPPQKRKARPARRGPSTPISEPSSAVTIKRKSANASRRRWMGIRAPPPQ